MSSRHRARRGVGARWLLGLALVCALVVPLGLGALAGTLTLPGPTTTSPSVTRSRTPVTTTPSIRPRGGCPPGFGPTPATPGACVSPTPTVVPGRPTTSTHTRVTTTEEP